MSISRPSWTALKALHDQFAMPAFEICATGQEVAPQLFVTAFDAQTKELTVSGMPPELMARFFRDDEGKNQFAAFMKAMLSEGHPMRQSFISDIGFEPEVLVQVNEGWALAPGESAEADYVSGKSRISEPPSRQEVLMVSLHMRAGTVMVMHRIDYVPKRHCVPGEFPAESDFDLHAGRFTMQDAFAAEDATKH